MILKAMPFLKMNYGLSCSKIEKMQGNSIAGGLEIIHTSCTSQLNKNKYV